MMKIDIVKVAKLAGYVLPALGGLSMTWANNQESKRAVLETTKKLFETHVVNK